MSAEIEMSAINARAQFGERNEQGKTERHFSAHAHFSPLTVLLFSERSERLSGVSAVELISIHLKKPHRIKILLLLLLIHLQFIRVL